MTPKGLRTVAYRVKDIKKATEWYSRAFEKQPYFIESYYVGFNIGGYELGLMPTEDEGEKSENILTYWGVDDIDKSFQHFLDCGATVHEKPNNVGGELMVASVKDPWANIIGLIYNPYFKVEG
jgi:lactoylglutathione lyase